MALPEYFGWFDAPGQTEPAHMPADSVACPLCGQPRGAKGRTRGDGKSLLVNIDVWGRDAGKSYFVLLHRDCRDAATDEQIDDVLSPVVDGGYA